MSKWSRQGLCVLLQSVVGKGQIMENSFHEITSGVGQEACPPDTQIRQEHGAPDLLDTGNSSSFKWVEPEVDNGYSYINAGTCPDCGAGMVRQGNCFSCPSCGWGCCGWVALPHLLRNERIWGLRDLKNWGVPDRTHIVCLTDWACLLSKKTGYVWKTG